MDKTDQRAPYMQMLALHAVGARLRKLSSSSSSSFSFPVHLSMAPPVVSLLVMELCLSVLLSTHLAAGESHNVVDLGADPRGETDSAAAFRRAWSLACQSPKPAIVLVPAGRFLVSSVVFKGPCNNTRIEFSADGATVVAPADYASFGQSNAWIKFEHVEGVSINGGTLDGRGKSLWACKAARKGCPVGPKACMRAVDHSLTIRHSKDVHIAGLASINSKSFHIMIRDSARVWLRNVTVSAPGDSRNTDGIHVKDSDDVRITNATIGTGDDCIAMSAGTTNLLAEDISCGPGHGISIGSLGDDDDEAGVANITVTGVVFSGKGTQNGLRIKTWAKPSGGFVRGVSFQDVIMQGVGNPILIDQTYCPGIPNCPAESSGVKISNVTYGNIRGTSSSEVAVKFDCSSSRPCTGIHLHDVNITYQGRPAKSSCKNAMGTATGYLIPPISCLKEI
ncbi:hypothetical protein Taro_019908 [Colocasia esculenta]|uniref:Exopolygalacturonase n=1 Tax=Colocasia esculenta TaxID=4460 RepID=A0A843UXJ3_COLES|nr:hypothetical protein [Colocasia esculenta]